MKNAHKHREYHNVHGFEAPDGIVTAAIDEQTGQLATPPALRSGTRCSSRDAASGDLPLACSGRTQITSWEPSAKPTPTVIPTIVPR